MVGLNHALTGALVAVVIDEPAVSLPAALLSHFVVDALPHWNYRIPGNKRLRPQVIGTDLLLSTFGIAVLALILDVNFWLFFLGGFLGILPDAMWLPYIVSGKQTPRDKKTPLHLLRRLHAKVQWSETYQGALFEAGWLMLVCSILLLLI